MNIRFLLLFLLHGIYLTGMEVTFFNVGQGNCTLVTCPGQKTMLVDAGFSKGPLGDRKCSQVTSDVIMAIKQKTPDKQLFVVASHADKDHIKLLSDICKPLIKAQFTIEFLLGGTPALYKKKEGKELLAFLETHKSSCKKTFASEVKGDGKVRAKEFAKIVPPYAQVLAAITEPIDQKKLDSNDTSIVLKLRDKYFTALLPGDATGKVTETLIAHNRLHLGSTVYELSHHGAESDNSTNLPLLLAVNPKVLIISAGLFEGRYMHPRFETIKTSVEYCVKRNHTDAHPHMLTYQHANGIAPYKGETDETRFHVVAVNTDGFCTAQTTFPIFNTADVGTITCCANGVSVSTEVNPQDNNSTRILKSIHTPRFDRIRFLFLNNGGIESKELKDHLIALPTALEYLDLRNNFIGHNGIEHLVMLYKNHPNSLIVKIADNRLVDKKALTLVCKKKAVKSITNNNRILLTFHKKGLKEDTVESLEFSRGHNSQAPFQHDQAKAYASDSSKESDQAHKNKIALTGNQGQEIIYDLSHDDNNLFIAHAKRSSHKWYYEWPGITDICLLSDKNQTVAGITTAQRSALFNFANNEYKNLVGRFRYTNPTKPWKTIGKEFWSLETPGVPYYHERTPFSKNGKFVLTVSAKKHCINIYETDPLLFDPQHVKLHKSITEDELKNDLGHSIPDIKRVEFCDGDHSIKCHFTDKTKGELRFILEPNEI